MLMFMVYSNHFLCNVQLKKYMLDFEYINGAFDKNFVGVLDLINKYQIKNQIFGNLAEIGVYQGKSFIPIYLLANEGEYVLAIDCFDNQEFNYDFSGYASNYDKFIKNLLKYSSGNLEKLKILKCDSSEKTSSDYVSSCGGTKFRIFSIDGCHSSKVTYIDLKNAFLSLIDGGIIIVDDYFNKDWPGVSEGVANFMIENNELRPFFIGWNKVIFAHINYVNYYLNLFRQYPGLVKESILFNSKVLIFNN